MSVKSKNGLTAWISYAAVRSAFCIMQMFPIEWNLRTARLLARFWMFVLPRHRNRAITHLKLAFGEQYTEAQYALMARQCLESWAMSAVEVACLPRIINRFNWSRHVRLADFLDVLDVITRGEGVILVTGHFGPFELVGHFLASLGFDMVAVMRPLDNVHLNRFLVQSRRIHGLKLLDKKGAMKESEAILQRGALLALVGDQDAGRKGMFVDFFGTPASTYKSIGLLAMQTGAPIVVGYARRLGHDAQYEIGATRIIRKSEWEDKDDPLRWITETYTHAIETFVRQAPEQYLWIHRRWKSQPRGSKRAP